MNNKARGKKEKIRKNNRDMHRRSKPSEQFDKSFPLNIIGSRYYDRDARSPSKGETDCGNKSLISREVIVYGDNFFTDEERVEHFGRMETIETSDYTICPRQIKVNKIDLNRLSNQDFDFKTDVKRPSRETTISESTAKKREDRPWQKHLAFTYSNDISREREKDITENSKRKRYISDEHERQKDAKIARAEKPHRVVFLDPKCTYSTDHIEYPPNQCNHSSKTEVCVEERTKIADIIGRKLKKYRRNILN